MTIIDAGQFIEYQLCIRVKPQAIPVLKKRLLRIMEANATVVAEEVAAAEESDFDLDLDEKFNYSTSSKNKRNSTDPVFKGVQIPS